MADKLTLAQLYQLYEEFAEEFDPSPHFSEDDYQSMPDFHTWFELDKGGFGDVIDERGLNPDDYKYLPTT